MVEEVNGFEEGEGKRELVTRDLLGGGKAFLGTAEVGVELDNGADWERTLDQLFGKTILRKADSGPLLGELHDLNLPPPSSGVGLILDTPSSLDLSLSAVSTAVCATSSSTYRSVCTLEKVKSALKRAERESRWSHPRRSDCGSSASPSTSTTSSSLKRRSPEEGDWAEAQDSPPLPPSLASGGMIAAGCPGCLLYVLISTLDPRCPRCDSHVPIPALKKQLRFDLNCSSLQYC